MKRWSLAELEPFWKDLEALADASPGADPWCSAPDWLFPVHAAFAPESEPILLGDPKTGIALLARYPSTETNTIAGLEPLWGFASPAIGPQRFEVLIQAFDELRRDLDWSHAVLPGIPANRATIAALATELESHGEISVGEGITRQLADLSQGPRPWWARRSSKFRNQLRKATEHAAQEGVEYETITDQIGLFDRLLDIEARSWKGQAEDGITSPAMSHFYRAMITRLADRGRLQATIAIKDGLDVGFIVGGVRNGRYRGMQLSYATEVKELSLGHVLQLYEIQRLPAEVDVHTYDLGMDMEYKRRWSDISSSSATLVIRRT
jgi:CelD/BcsL family acetyltransferase involved in cellulose biosynthesis